jgi:hypothetical protein
MEYELSQHAQDVIREREIQDHWIKQVLSDPGLIEKDPFDDQLEHRLGRIKECSHRVLRVVLNRQAQPVRIVTVYFDRKMKGKL